MAELLKVNRIASGVVIDRMPPFTSMLALRVLGLPYDRPSRPYEYVVIPLMNVQSRTLGRRKDILKIEGNEELIALVKEKEGALALISEDIVVHMIRDWEKSEKYKPVLQEEIVGLVNCPHYNCITHKPKEPGSKDDYSTKFRVIGKNPLVLQCQYCPNEIGGSQILENIIV